MKPLQIALAAFLLSACAALGTASLDPAKLAQQSLDTAEAAATAADGIAVSLGTSITVQQEIRVRDDVRTVIAAVKTGRALLAVGDASGAQAQLAAVGPALAAIDALVTTHHVGAAP